MKSKYYDPAKGPYFDPATDKRVAYITGCTTGLGWYTVLHLYMHGYTVYAAGRSLERTQAALDRVADEAQKRTARYTESQKQTRWLGLLRACHIDLLHLQTVEAAAEEFGRLELRLHLLILNAGVMAIPHKITDDGFEVQYQTNVVGHALLTLKLLPTLLNVAKHTPIEPRVVNLSSVAHHFAYSHFHPSNTLKRKPNFFFTWVRYGHTKTASIHFVNWLARTHPNILCLSVHPGVVVGTELYNHWKQLQVVGPIAKASLKGYQGTVGVLQECGAFATLRAALDPALTCATSNGVYLVTGGVKALAGKNARSITYSNETSNWLVRQLEKRNFMVDIYPQ